MLDQVTYTNPRLYLQQLFYTIYSSLTFPPYVPYAIQQTEHDNLLVVLLNTRIFAEVALYDATATVNPPIVPFVFPEYMPHITPVHEDRL